MTGNVVAGLLTRGAVWVVEGEDGGSEWGTVHWPTTFPCFCFGFRWAGLRGSSRGEPFGAVMETTEQPGWGGLH